MVVLVLVTCVDFFFDAPPGGQRRGVLREHKDHTDRKPPEDVVKTFSQARLSKADVNSITRPTDGVTSSVSQGILQYSQE